MIIPGMPNSANDAIIAVIEIKAFILTFEATIFGIIKLLSIK